MIYQREFGEAVRLLANGAVRTDGLMSRPFPLDALDQAFAAHHSAAAVKVVVAPR